MQLDTIKPQHIGFLLIPEFSMFSFSSLIEPLRMANRVSRKTLYEWSIYTQNDQAVYASNGLPFQPSKSLENCQQLDVIYVVAGLNVKLQNTQLAVNWLKKLARCKIQMGATSTGTELLANAGLLTNKTCTIHWENRESLLEMHPELKVTSELYEIDGSIHTCSGGLAGLDMMLELIKTTHGLEVAQQVSEQCVHSNMRASSEEQRIQLSSKHKTQHPRLLRALELMQNHTEDILTCEEISQRVSLSTRQLERLFKVYLELTPSAHYINLRLEKAQHLLEQSDMSILQISTACGFNSTSYFARCYQKRYQHSPSMERKPKSHSRTPSKNPTI